MKSHAFLLAALLPLTSFADPDTSTGYSGNGFTIQVLEQKEAVAENVSPIMMALPAKNGFASNVNVMIQPYGESLDSYIELSKGQYETAGISLLNENKAGDKEWVVEYTGTMRQYKLHWYARAILDQGKVFLVTATTTEDEWPQLESELREVVDSFKLK